MFEYCNSGAETAATRGAQLDRVYSAVTLIRRQLHTAGVYAPEVQGRGLLKVSTLGWNAIEGYFILSRLISPKAYAIACSMFMALPSAHAFLKPPSSSWARAASL